MSESAGTPAEVALGREVRDLRERVARLEAMVFRAVVVVACVAIVVGFFLPFLVATKPKDEDESLSLLTAAFALGDAGGGPFSEEAALAALVVGGFVLLALVTLVVLATVLRAAVSKRNLAVARGFSIALLVGCCVAWLLVFALAGHFEGRSSAFSPALAALTVGAVLGVVVRRFAPEDLRA